MGLGTPGTLLKCDSNTAAIVAMMNDVPELGNFILRQLDDKTFMVVADKVEWVKESVMAFLEKDIWTKGEAK
jgi:hypothetical protein